MPPDLSCTKYVVPDSGQELSQLHVFPTQRVCVEGNHSQANWVPAQTLVKCWPGSFKADTDVQTWLALTWEPCPGTTTVLAFSSG